MKTCSFGVGMITKASLSGRLGEKTIKEFSDSDDLADVVRCRTRLLTVVCCKRNDVAWQGTFSPWSSVGTSVNSVELAVSPVEEDLEKSRRPAR